MSLGIGTPGLTSDDHSVTRRSSPSASTDTTPTSVTRSRAGDAPVVSMSTKQTRGANTERRITPDLCHRDASLAANDKELLHLLDVVVRVAVDAFVVRVDAGELRFLVHCHADALLAGFDRTAFEQQDRARGEVLLARLRGEHADVERFIQRRFGLLALAVGVELARFDIQRHVVA